MCHLKQKTNNRYGHNMNDFLRAQYEAARTTSLRELADMLQRNDEYAERNGGVEQLPDNIRRTYEARKTTIIRLSAYHDRAQEYIEDLQEWISRLIQENRRLATESSEARTGWKKYFPNMTNPNQTESDREHRRQMSITNLQLEQPELF